MRRVGELIYATYPLGALSTGTFAFYETPETSSAIGA